ncbi:hypothetical protein Pcinc_012535 [Petrolisthes cinctipes]|uniref:ABC transporter domain-containing protein n=1 Tax=Petrolisthes cinctipes TaxID=88211 RepID=A0AAE1FYN8_PETCI|nr:hypothetical protein Pcinc_012535 [Petrolisthes cinctipes]
MFSDMQALLELPEYQARTREMNGNLAVVMRNGCYARDVTSLHYHPTNKEQQPGERDGLLSNNKPESTSSTSPPPSYKKSNNTSPLQFVNVLFGVNMMVKRGKLVGVCGDAGSGKTSLISAICGELIGYDGECLVNGKLALVTQTPWTYNHTLQDNILMANKMSTRRYKNVMWACSLEADVERLPNGDLTEIGTLELI